MLRVSFFWGGEVKAKSGCCYKNYLLKYNFFDHGLWASGDGDSKWLSLHVEIPSKRRTYH